MVTSILLLCKSPVAKNYSPENSGYFGDDSFHDFTLLEKPRHTQAPRSAGRPVYSCNLAVANLVLAF